MDKLVKEGVLSKTGADNYVINKLKVTQFLCYFISDFTVFSFCAHSSLSLTATKSDN